MKIDKPCPVYFSKKNKIGEGNFCRSCNKEVVDFTNKTPEEINKSLTADGCGIFRYDQLHQQPRMRFSKRLIFNFLTLISFFGFNVQPINAEPVRKVRKITIESSVKEDKDKKEKHKKKRIHHRRRLAGAYAYGFSHSQ